jgi:hypothetical protein
MAIFCGGRVSRGGRATESDFESHLAVVDETLRGSCASCNLPRLDDAGWWNAGQVFGGYAGWSELSV